MGDSTKIRYAAVGLGHIAQMAVLPAFEHARENSELNKAIEASRPDSDLIKEKPTVKSGRECK